MNSIHTLFIIFLSITGNNGYRILTVFPINSWSHNIFLEGVSRGLANHGHQVDAITHFEMKNPPKNYRTIINLNGTKASLINSFTIDYASQLGGNFVSFIAQTYGNEFCELLSHDEIQKFVKNPPEDPPYDVVITEAFGPNCFMGLGYILKVPVVAVATALEYPWVSGPVGNPESTAFARNVLTDLDEISTFWDRLKNTIVTELGRYKFYIYTEQAQTEAMKKYLSQDIPNIREVERNVALTFVNSFHTLFGVRIRSPNFIDIAGIHVEDNNDKLPPDLQKWMDESEHGVVYFTLGSMVIIETLPKETLLSFYESFAAISPMKVLMKIVDTGKLPPNLPKNVRTLKWIPQIPVLRHQNTLLFMCHGGLIGMEEALYYGIPLIGFPLFGDQFSNVRMAVKKNIAIALDYKNVTKQSLDEALHAVLRNPVYREAAKRESQLFRDRPMTAKDTMIFWVEYVVRHGSNALRSPAVDLYWWQIALLDVYGFILSFFIIMICIILSITKYIFYLLFKNGKRCSQFRKKKDS